MYALTVIYHTRSALYWTLWVLLSIMLCVHSPTELHKRSWPIGASLPNARAGQQYIRRLRLPTVILFLFSEQQQLKIEESERIWTHHSLNIGLALHARA